MTQEWNDEAYYDDEEYYEEAAGRSWSTMALVLSGLAGVLIGFACAACLGGVGLALLLLPAESSSAPVPTDTFVGPPTAAPTPQMVNPPPAPETPPFVSGGLGLPQPEWEQRYGPGSPSETAGYLWYRSAYLVAFQDGQVAYIERRWSPENPATIEDARLLSSELIPTDRQLIQSYNPGGRPDLVVDLYLSPSLAGRFAGNPWVGGQPGNFTIAYSVFDVSVTRMVIKLGNNP
ncbi:MAG: hypothetical protein Kow0063_27140 [Anaerolineae bacterium]